MNEEFIQDLQDIFEQFSDEGAIVDIYPLNNYLYSITISKFLGPDILENIPYPLIDETYANDYAQKVKFQLDRFNAHYDFTYSIIINFDTIIITAFQNSNPPIEEELNSEELPF